MITPTQYDSYPDYVAACRVEDEVPASPEVWHGWKFPKTDPDQPPTSTYLTWLLKQIPALKDRGHGGDPDGDLLWTIIRELRLQDARLRALERVARDEHADGR